MKYCLRNMKCPADMKLLRNEVKFAQWANFIEKENPDVTVVVCDATCLERNLILVLKTLAVTRKVIVCVNLIDEAKKKGITVDSEALSRELTVPVVLMSARRGKGVEELLKAIVSGKFCEGKNEEKSIDETVNLAEKITKNSIFST